MRPAVRPLGRRADVFHIPIGAALVSRTLVRTILAAVMALSAAQGGERPSGKSARFVDPFEAGLVSAAARTLSNSKRATDGPSYLAYDEEQPFELGDRDADLRDEPTGESSIPEYPQDPLWPAWKPTDEPGQQPIFAPAGMYDLVHPPRGLWPEEGGQEYERVVGSDGDLFFHQATSPSPIDLFRPDGMAPAGIFGDHTLNTGGRVLVSYRFNNQAFDGLRSGAHSVSTASVLKQFPLAPTKMTAQEHYFVMEWGPTDDLTLQGIMPIVVRKIDYVGRDGALPVTQIADLYDISIYALYVLKRWDRQQIHANLGVQMPLGIFDELGQVPTPTSPELTYPMRTSDGTWDFLPGLTYRGQSNDWTWGIQGLGIVRFGINRYGYRLGDEGNFNGWISRRLTDWVSASARLNGHVWGNIFGADQRLNPDLVPTNRTNLQAGQRMSILFGLNFLIPDGVLQGQRLGIEGGIPIYQSLDGPQLNQRYEIWTNLSLTW